MKVIFKGILKSIDHLPKSNLPSTAKKFKEPNTFLGSGIVMIFYLIPVLIIVSAIINIVIKIRGEINVSFNDTGIIIALLMSIPHEILHAICYSKHSKVYLYFIPRMLSFAVVCTEPISKKRFVWMSLFPNLILGVIPFLAWCLLPNNNEIYDILFTYSLFSICMGCGDYMNIINAFIQMPSKSLHQLSGFNSYWYMENN